MKCMFALILHIICPITLTSAINLPQTYSRQKHKGLTIFALVWTAWNIKNNNKKTSFSFLFFFTAVEIKLSAENDLV